MIFVFHKFDTFYIKNDSNYCIHFVQILILHNNLQINSPIYVPRKSCSSERIQKFKKKYPLFKENLMHLRKKKIQHKKKTKK